MHQPMVLVIGNHWGMRSGTIRGLRWNQVDWDANLVRLEKKQTKSKQARNAPLYGELRAWFEHAFTARDAACPFIVHYRGAPVGSLKTSWMAACQRAGIPEKRAMLISGHRTRSVFDRYDIVDERDLQEDGRGLALYLEERARLAEVRTKSIQSGEIGKQGRAPTQ